MPENAKNRLLAILQNLGSLEDCADFQTVQSAILPSAQHTTIATVTFEDGRVVQGTGHGSRKLDAEIAASEAVIDTLRQDHPDLLVSWNKIYMEAQAGDALIKLGVYLAASLKTASEKANKLRTLESDLHLAEIFEQWKAKGDPDLAIFGDKISEKKKATLVEAILWRRYRKQVLKPEAGHQLKSLLQNLQ